VDMFSVWLDDAERSGDPQIVSHVYRADDGCDLMDETQWYKSNPALGVFRNYDDLKSQLDQAQRMPTRESSARNLLLNERISMDTLAFPPSVWKRCDGEIDFDVFRKGPVHMGLDLSARGDLTAAVCCAEDENGIVHVLPYVFCPTSGIEDRSRRDRAPYSLWVQQGHMIPIGGQTMDFDQIADALQAELSEIGIEITSIQYDKHMIDHFKAACDRVGVFTQSEWVGVPQFFKDMGARLSSLTSLMIESKLRHGGQPCLTMSASVAVAKAGREGVSALAKNLSTQRIDPMIALTMAAWPFGDGREAVEEFSVEQYVI
jgi:phage terminase large subunit-like protein